ncbi:MAG: NAD(P)-dependent oxidoreductase [Alphaproteobacteria bacterium]|nr:NAD(P)-dependent oxidoreductase [Alphaproteobacteria bacterium]
MRNDDEILNNIGHVMKVLIIGANGFLGREITSGALLRKWDVGAVLHRHKHEVPPDASIVEMENPGLFSVPDTVILAAAAISNSGVTAWPDAMREGNIGLVLKTVEQFPESHIVFCSSVSVYGSPMALPLTENSPYCQPTAYGLTKLAGETIVGTSRTHTIIRFSSLYGRGMSRETFLPRIIEAARTGIITLLGDGSRRQDYLHVSDAATLVLQAAERRITGCYLGAYGRSLSNRAVADAVCKALPNVKVLTAGVDDSTSLEFDTSKTRGAFPFTPALSPERGIAALAHV